MIFFYSFEFIIIAVIFLLCLVLGVDYAICEIIISYSEVIAVIAGLFIAVGCIFVYCSSKKILLSVFTAVCLSQWAFFIVRGLFLLGTDDSLKKVFLFPVYCLYVLFDSCFSTMSVVAATGKPDDPDTGVGQFGLVALGVVGWIVNFIFLL